MISKGGTPKSDKSPLKWDPPIKQPWGLLIRGQHYNIHISASGSDFHFSISEYQGLNCVHILQTSPETAQVLVNHANDRSGLKIASACERPPWRKKRHSVGGVTPLGGLVVDSLEKNNGRWFLQRLQIVV